MDGNPFDLSGMVSVVTGASSGIGAEIARAMGSAGSQVVLVGRSKDRLDSSARAVVTTGAEALYVVADTCADDAPRTIVDETLARFGRLDVLVHSAGVFLPKPFAETTIEAFDSQWDTNVRAPFRLTQAALGHLAPGSSVIFVSSVGGHVGSPDCSAYCASKGAVELLVKSLSSELAPIGIRVNAVAPGDVHTPMNAHLMTPEYEQGLIDSTPARRVGVVGDIAPAVVFLASPAASYVHGVSLLIDGGFAAQ